MGLDRPAFTPMRLEEERSNDSGTVFTVRLNEEEYQELKVFMGMINTDQPSTALKAAADVGLKFVLQPLFRSGSFRRLFKKGIQEEQRG